MLGLRPVGPGRSLALPAAGRGGLPLLRRIKARLIPDIVPAYSTQTLNVSFAQMFAPFEPLPIGAPQNYQMLEKRYGASAWIYQSVQKKAKDIASAPFLVSSVKANGTTEPLDDEDHPLVKLLKKPNPWMAMAALVRITSIWLDLTGNAFWLIFRGKDGKPREFYPINPIAVTAFAEASSPARLYRIWHYGRQFMARAWGYPDQPGEILHFRLDNPTSDSDSAWPSVWGVGPLESSWSLVVTEEDQTKWNRNLVRNDGRPSGLLVSDQEIADAEATAAAEEFRKSFAGPQGAGKVLVLGKGLRYERMAIAPKEMDYTESRRDLREEIISTFGLNSAVLGWAQGDVGRRSELVREYWSGTIVGTSNSYLLPPLNEFIVPEFESGKTDLLVSQDFSGVPALQEDEVARWGWVRQAWSVGVRLNDLIDAYKLPVEHQPGGDKAYLPMSLQEATDEPTPPPGAGLPPELMALMGGGRRPPSAPRGQIAQGAAAQIEKPEKPEKPVEKPEKPAAAEAET